jgi:hypothetical protein
MVGITAPIGFASRLFAKIVDGHYRDGGAPERNCTI